MQSLQRQAALLQSTPINTDPHCPTQEVLTNTGWLSVHHHSAYMILQLKLRIIATGKPHHLASRLSKAENSRTKRGQLKVPHCRLNVSLEGFIHQATRLFNKLPVEIASNASKSQRKLKLRQWVLENVALRP